MHASTWRKIRPLKSLSSSSHDDDDHHHHHQHVDVDKESEQHGSDEGGKVEDEEEDMHHFDEKKMLRQRCRPPFGRKARKEKRPNMMLQNTGHRRGQSSCRLNREVLDSEKKGKGRHKSCMV